MARDALFNVGLLVHKSWQMPRLSSVVRMACEGSQLMHQLPTSSLSMIQSLPTHVIL